MSAITYQDFDKVEIHTGKIVRVEDFPKARKPAYKLWIDFGALGQKQSSAQITQRYTKDELIGKTIIAVTNFPPKQVADFMSEVLVLGVPDEEQAIVLLEPGRPVPAGKRMY